METKRVDKNIKLLVILLAISILSSCSVDSKIVGYNHTTLDNVSTSFVFDASLDTMIVGRMGTQLFIKSYSFEEESGKSITGDIEILLEEFLEPDIIAKSNLSTCSERGLLETAGMISLRVLSKGKLVRFKKDDYAIVRIPNRMEVDLSEMNIFYTDDVPSKSTNVNWIEDTTKLFSKNIDISWYGYDRIRESSPEFEYIIKSTSDSLKSKTIYSTLEDYSYQESTITEVDSYNGLFKIEFTLERDGKLTNPVLPSDVSASTESDLMSYLNNLPYFVPYHDNVLNKDVEISGSFCLYCHSQPNFTKDFEYKKLFETKYLREDGKLVGKLDMEELEYYLFTTSNLSLINIDRFLDFDKTHDLAVQILKDSKDVTVKMIFKNMNSYVNAKLNLEGDEYLFENIPVNQEIMLLAIQEKENELYCGVKYLTTSNDTTVTLDLSLVTVEDLAVLSQY
jgi:hypothetical protein